jgi:hypothetical protein
LCIFTQDKLTLLQDGPGPNALPVPYNIPLTPYGPSIFFFFFGFFLLFFPNIFWRELKTLIFYFLGWISVPSEDRSKLRLLYFPSFAALVVYLGSLILAPVWFWDEDILQPDMEGNCKVAGQLVPHESIKRKSGGASSGGASSSHDDKFDDDDDDDDIFIVK